MAIGRKITFTWSTSSPAEIPGVREKSLSLNGEPVDLTADDSDGHRVLADEAGEDQVNISLSGVTKDDTLKAAWFSGDRTETATLTYEDGGVVSGLFFLATYSETQPYNDAVSFEAELQSTGEIVYTPPA